MTGTTQGIDSNRSYGFNKNHLVGTVTSIKDPEKRGRVQIRITHYHDGQGVNKDDLEWHHVPQQNSQIAGHSQTQPYYAGASVMVAGSGPESYVMGSHPGFDSEKRLQNQDPPQLDNSDNTKPDMPNIVRGEKQTSVRSSPGIRDSISKGGTEHFNYGSWSSMHQHMYPYALGTGGNKSPFNQGDKAKLHELKSLGTQKMKNGSDVLDDTDKMDDNFSGAFKPATKVVRNLRNNGYGNGIQGMGGQQIGQAEGIFNGVFGTTANNSNAVVQSLINLIASLIKAVEFVNSLTPLNVYEQSNNFGIAISPCQNVILEISPDLVNSMESDLYQILAGGPDLPTKFYSDILSQFDGTFTQAMSQGSLNLLAFLNNMAGDPATVTQEPVNNNQNTTATGDTFDNPGNPFRLDVGLGPNTLSQIVFILGGITLCTELANELLQYDNLVGIPQEVTYGTCQGVIGLAIQGKLGNLPLYTPANTAPTQGTDSPSDPSSLSKWHGNKVAMGELMSGKLDNKFLTNISNKSYQDADRNHGPSALKKHTERIPNYSNGPTQGLDYSDKELAPQMADWTSGKGYDSA